MRLGRDPRSRAWIGLLAIALTLGMVPASASAAGLGSAPEGTELGYWPLDADQDDSPAPGMSRDASAHDHHLTKKGIMETQTSPDPAFDEGYGLYQGLGLLDSGLAAAHLVSPWSEAIGTRELSLFVAFERATVGDGDVLVQLQEPSYDGVGDTSLNLKILAAEDGNVLHYRHEDARGDRLNLEGEIPVEEGYHTLTLQRTWNAATGQGELSIKVDGETHLEETFHLEPAHQGTRRASLGAFQTGVQPLDGALFEVRLWDHAVDQATLDSIAEDGRVASGGS